MGERNRDVLSRAAAALAFAGALSVASGAEAKDADALVLPSVTPVSECVTCPALHAPDPDSERKLAGLARELDSIVVDAAQDLGLSVDLSARPSSQGEPPSEARLFELASKGWVFSPRLALDGNRVLLRLVAVAPGSKVLFVRSEEIRPEEIEVRAVLMMRDLVHARTAPAPESAPPTPKSDARAVVHEARSRGRAILALNTAVFGGYIGYSLQRASGSNDARLTYPLVALGTGIGIGGSLIVAEEWDIGVGDAWYLSAGMWWPTLGALLIGDSYHQPNKRYVYGAAAAAGGLAAAATALSFGDMSEGGALIAHSGGGFGTVLGGIADLAIQGRTNVTPTRGMGVGSIVGVVVTGALARFAPHEPPSRVLLVDLAAGLGGLTGAAAASPLIFGDHVGKTRNRLWLSSIALGTFVGAGVGYFLTAGSAKEPHEGTTILPTMGVIDSVRYPDGSVHPVTGGGIQGTF